jgi:hypothetical protein
VVGESVEGGYLTDALESVWRSVAPRRAAAAGDGQSLVGEMTRKRETEWRNEGD